ncbi:hypothetical protein PUNSTDRAFT_75791 [Punctularia strigosozonata HHB-11173 SS5]|uniref:Cytochrome P450 n=1 Tax=Punctularia strigosozonata (strain HHB-11173) TaxID=741275 RepID=R7S2R0_PUNST|nr:uncharacterized protein PUNSTDRAFT_75791 [Punctularia strigosozonata HHB-11173 SS5]EIN04670.1 hypothetical protein PUNSTDRAFT_75791 [Punctularia strigosozonata HHB-11173 SS5]
MLLDAIGLLRVCPERHFGDQAFFLLIASMLSVFRISPPVDGQDHEILLEPKRKTGLIAHPEPFTCVIEPRSEKATGRIRQKPN